jgi:hypothetical protein
VAHHEPEKWNSEGRVKNLNYPQSEEVLIGCFQALIEQVSYGPFAMISFFFFMSILEGRGVQAAKQEVADKFWATYKV